MSILQQMTAMGHERVAFHQDSESGLRAVIAVHDTTLGNALGGTRRWCYASEADAIRDVLRLSEGMTYKSAAAGLARGGAKSVILLDHPGQEPTEAQARAMGRFVDTLDGAYIAAEDVGVSPQFCAWMREESDHVMGDVAHGGDPSPYTSLGCFNAMKSCLAFSGRPTDFAGLTVAIQGLGATGYKLARFVREAGGDVVAADVDPVAIRRATEELGVGIVDDDQDLFSLDGIDIIAPCALGAVLGEHNIERIKAPIVCGTANNILADPEGDGRLLKDRGIVYAPDFIANAGGVIHLAGLYLGLTPPEIDAKVAEIEHTTLTILEDTAAHASAYDAAVAFAKQRIEAGRTPQAV
ncbi:MAG: Glu/Leu/Phe/Val dehydrogenase dimerization domain-containing protein [Planctomycetota bacterium]|nr:Glu/Leu/Phe/Val dehydrogenase dimerization domain-containing protein [Planctomycetota bacterium]